MHNRWRGTDGAWIAGLALGTWGVWHVLVLRTPTQLRFEAADLFLSFVPSYVYEAARLRELGLPLWNPYQGTGIPFLATLLPGTLYPARLLLLLVDVPTAMAWSTIGHLVVLVIGTYVLCRRLGARPAGAAVGAGAFAVACGRPMLFVPSWLEPITWLPVAALAAERVIVTGRWRWVVLLGVSAAMPVLAGGYQVSVYFVYGLVIVAVAILCDRRRRGVRPLGPILGQLVLAGTLAISLSAPQLLPTLAWSGEAVRQVGQLRDGQIDPWAFFPWQQVLIGKLWQLTLPAAILAAVGFSASGAFGAVLGVCAVVGCMLSLGPVAPGFALYHVLPAFGTFRAPARIFTTLVAFLCAIGAALGFTAIVGARRVERSRRRPLLEASAFAIALAFLVPKMRSDAVLPWTSSTTLFLTGIPGMFPLLRESDARVALFGHGGDWSVTDRQGMMHQVRVLTDYDPLVSRRLRDYIRALQGLPIDDLGNVPFTGWILPKERLAHPELLDLAAVRHVLLVKGAPVLDRTPAPEWIADFAVYELLRNPAALPRAYVVDRARVVADERAALATITDPDFDGQREAVLVGETGDGETEPLRTAPPMPARAIRIALDAPEHVALEFDTDHTALLVLVDAFAPGWSVRVDGAPRRLRQVNHLVRGVVVHPGENRAEFTYRAPGLAPGAVSAALGAGTVTVCAMAGWFRRRRPEDIT